MMLTRRLGRTGHESSVAIAGGIAFDHTSGGEDTERLLREFLDAGVNHLDIAPGYRTAEEKVGRFLPEVREQLFVGEKTAQQDEEGARADLERSLQRLQCGYVDLYQLHGVVSLADLDRRDGAASALMKAREEGLCRFLGITGHDVGAPAAHAEAIRRYDLDTVMFPVFPRLWSNDEYRHDALRLLELCGERDVGIMIIKAVAARPWSGPERSRTTWYEPYDTGAEIERGVRFALSTPGVHAFCTPGDIEVARLALEAAGRFEPMTARELEEAVEEVGGEPALFPLGTP